MNRIRLEFLFIILASLQGCSNSARYSDVPLAVVNGIDSRLHELRLGMSEPDVLRALGLAPYSETVMLHSVGGGSFGFTRRYTFPPNANYTLTLTIDAAGHVTQATLARQHDSVEWVARVEPSAKN